VREITFYLNSFPNPFVVKELPIDVLRKVVKIYRQYKKHIKDTVTKYYRNAEAEYLKRERYARLNSYVYGVSVALQAEASLSDDIEQKNAIRELCSPVFTMLAIDVEKIIKNLSVAVSQDERYMDKLKEKKIFSNLQTSTLGTLIHDYIIWLEQIATQEDKDNSICSVSIFKKLPQIVEYRNYFVHSGEQGPNTFDKKKISKFAETVMDCTLLALNLIFDYESAGGDGYCRRGGCVIP
jgi:hypothetical protein